MEDITHADKVNPQPSPSSTPLSPQLAHSRSQASVSPPPKVSETPLNANMVKNSSRVPLPKLLADLPPIPTFDSSGLNHSPSRHGRSRPLLSRHRTSEALRSSNRSPTSPSSSSGGSLRSSRRATPSPRSARTKNGLLYPPPGDNRKKAASLDDLSLPNVPASPLSSLAPADLASLLPASMTVMSHRKYSNRVSEYGVRRWHALMELVSTEEGYVKDLKILVKIYLDQLSTVTVLEHGARAEIARNADALLIQHKAFVRKLQEILDTEGIKNIDSTRESSMILAEPQLDRAIREVSKLFIEEANAFRLYESFCAGHSQAVDVIRKLQNQPEWDLFEKRCAIIVATEGDEVLKSPDPVLARRHSTDVVKLEDAEILPKASRLTMADFLIKPIQRICKYPLILGQLQPDSNFHAMRISGKKTPEEQIEGRALDVMKRVAAKVDDARKKMEIAIKSKLIVERVSEKALPELNSLGDCWLAGSLDVLYHHETIAPLSTPVKIKYLGAFLYAGWFLLVKVLKHKVYEPKYWFPLSLAQIVDIPENDALLPASFRISCGDHHFELAAACAQEKSLWITSLKEARTKFPLQLSACHLPSSLNDEPIPPATGQSHVQARKPARKATDPAPTLNDVLTVTPHRKSSLGALEEWGMAHIGSTTDEPSGMSTASASAPVLAPAPLRDLLEGEVSTVLIRRASANHRTLVDRGLQDIFSDLCIAVRVTAQMKEPLFQPPKLTAGSSSTITARNTMTKRNSVLLRRQRHSTDAAEHNPTSSSMSSVASKFALTRNKSAHAIDSLKELRRRTLAVPFNLFDEKDEAHAPHLSRPSTAGSSNTSSQPATPIAAAFTDANSDVDGLVLQSKRRKKRMSRLEEDLPKRPVTDYPLRFNNAHVPQAVHLDVTKDLPPTPKLGRRRTLMSPLTLRSRPNSEFDAAQIESKRPYTVFAVGHGLTNIGPNEHLTESRSSLNLKTSSLIRKSLNALSYKRNKSTPNYVANLFNRSAVSVVHDSSSSASHSRTFFEPPSTPTKQPSASTPALQEALTAWELISPNISKRPSANDFLVPPVPPLPPIPQSHSHSISQSPGLRRSKSSLRKKSSQFFSQLNRLSHISTNRDS